VELQDGIYKIIQKRPFLLKFFRAFFGSHIINDFYLYERFCRFLANQYDKKKPLGNLKINIETTLSCNASCIMCSRQSLPITSGFMEENLYLKIIKEAHELGVQEVILSVYGEPLLDPHFLRRAKIADEAKIQFSFYSNGSLLNDVISKELLRMKRFQTVFFSVCGFSKETYENIMKGLNRDSVYSNILRFLELKNQIRPNLSVVITCVLFEKNIYEMKQLRDFFNKQKGIDFVYFPAIRNRGGISLDVEASGESVEFSPLSRKGHKLLPCKLLWEDIFIYWNGDVGVCCEDSAARRIIIGNIGEQSLKEIWTGNRMKALRALHLKGNRFKHPVCGKACSYNSIWMKPSL